MSADETLEMQMNEFKSLFLTYLNHREFMVRKLAAKSLIGFTAKIDLLATMTLIIDLLRQNIALTNFQHGCLLSLTYGIKLLKSEYPQDYQLSKSTLESQVVELSYLKMTCPFNLFLLEELKLVMEMQIKDTKFETKEKYHPGYRDLMIQHGPPNDEENLDNCKRFLNNPRYFLSINLRTTQF